MTLKLAVYISETYSHSDDGKSCVCLPEVVPVVTNLLSAQDQQIPAAGTSYSRSRTSIRNSPDILKQSDPPRGRQTDPSTISVQWRLTFSLANSARKNSLIPAVTKLTNHANLKQSHDNLNFTKNVHINGYAFNESKQCYLTHPRIRNPASKYPVKAKLCITAVGVKGN